MKGVLKFALAVFCGYAALAALVYFQQSDLLYRPGAAGKPLQATPARIGLDFEDVSLVTEDGVELHGWYVSNARPRGVLLFFHGNAGNISHRLDSIAIFNRLDLDVFIIDYRGYGQSRGSPDEAGTYRDAEAAWDYLVETRSVEPGRIVVFGRSLGAAIAAWIAAGRNPAALIVESGFSSVPSMGRRLYPFLPVDLLARFEYDTRSYVSSIACPLLVLHSRDDEVVPFAEGRAIFEAAQTKRRFQELRGGHNDGFLLSGALYVDALRAFIDASLD